MAFLHGMYVHVSKWKPACFLDGISVMLQELKATHKNMENLIQFRYMPVVKVEGFDLPSSREDIQLLDLVALLEISGKHIPGTLVL